MKKKWLITLVGLTIALAAITGAGFALAGDGSDNDNHDVADDWKLVEVSGWPGGFSLRLPQGWQLNELQGIDSYVGEIIGGGGRLTYDFGWYSSSLVDDDDPQYIVTYEEIGGRQAKLVRPRAEGDGLITGVYFEDIDGSPLDIPSQNRLQISGVGLTPDQQETAVAIFRTIRSLAPEPSGDHIVTSIDDIDPNECNWVHNITACAEPSQRDDVNGICCKPLVEGEANPNHRDGPVNDPAVVREPGPGIAVGEPYPMPTADKACGPGATVAITSDGQVSCFDLGDGTGTVDDGPGDVVVEPQPPIEPTRTITIIDDMDPNECNWIHNINACFSDSQPPADIPMDEYTAMLWLAQEDLSHRLAVEIGSIKLAEIERAGWPVYWPDDPEPGVAYIEIALAGFRMVLEADGQAYEYETDTSERVVFVG